MKHLSATTLHILIPCLLLFQSLLVSAWVFSPPAHVLSARLRRLSGQFNRSEELYWSKVPVFQEREEFIYGYAGQLLSGMHQPGFLEPPHLRGGDEGEEEDSNEIVEQQSGLQLHAQASLRFLPNNWARLQMTQIELGVLNRHIRIDLHEPQPWELFEESHLSSDLLRQLELPVYFQRAPSHEGGMVPEKLRFHTEEKSQWSRNWKKAVISMLQLQLKKGGQAAEHVTDRLTSDVAQPPSRFVSSSYTVLEKSLEGQCPTTYVVRQQLLLSSHHRQWAGRAYTGRNGGNDLPLLNVTKAVDFQRCEWVAGANFGFPMGEGEEERFPRGALPPSLVQRSTVIDYMLRGVPTAFGVQRVRATSDYIYGGITLGHSGWTPAESRGRRHPATLRSVVTAELHFQGVADVLSEKERTAERWGGKVSTVEKELSYDMSDWDKEKQLFMYGKAQGEASHSSNASRSDNEMERTTRVERLIRKILRDQSSSVTSSSTDAFQELVEQLRPINYKELRHLFHKITNGSSWSDNHIGDKVMASQLLGSALAATSTQSALRLIVELITLEKEFPAQTVAGLVKTVERVSHSPSDEHIRLMLRLCDSINATEEGWGVAHKSCWLATSALIHKLCAPRPASKGGPLEGHPPICPLQKRIEYNKVLFAKFDQAKSFSGKILALATIGNAGLDASYPHLESIIKGYLPSVHHHDETEPFVRGKAIDALRRLPTSQLERIKLMLLPIVYNHTESTMVRMSAAWQLMISQPSASVVYQLAMFLPTIRDKHLGSFLQSLLEKIVGADMEKGFGTSWKNGNGKIRLGPIELNTITAFSGSTLFGLPEIIGPSHFCPVTENSGYSMGLYIGQSGVEHWLAELATKWEGAGGGRKSRGSPSYRSSPFSFFFMRCGAVEEMIWVLEREDYSKAERMLLGTNRNRSLAFPLEVLASMLPTSGQHPINVAVTLAQRFAYVPTSVGVPLRLSHSLPAMVSAETHFESRAGDKLKLEWKSVSAAVTHVHKMETALPQAPNVGVQMVQSMELNVPSLRVALQLRTADGNSSVDTDPDHHSRSRSSLRLTLEGPLSHDEKGKRKANHHRLLSLHSVPSTFTTAGSDPWSEPRIKAIHDGSHHPRQEIDLTLPRTGVTVRGHYHWSARRQRETGGDFSKLADVLLSTENHLYFGYGEHKSKRLELKLAGGVFESVGHAEVVTPIQDFSTFYSNWTLGLAEDNGRNVAKMLQQRHLNAWLERMSRAIRTYRHWLRVEAAAGAASSASKREQIHSHLQVSLECRDSMDYCRMAWETKANTSSTGPIWDINALSSFVRIPTPQPLPKEGDDEVNDVKAVQDSPEILLGKTRVDWVVGPNANEAKSQWVSAHFLRPPLEKAKGSSLLRSGQHFSKHKGSKSKGPRGKSTDGVEGELLTKVEWELEKGVLRRMERFYKMEKMVHGLDPIPMGTNFTSPAGAAGAELKLVIFDSTTGHHAVHLTLSSPFDPYPIRFGPLELPKGPLSIASGLVVPAKEERGSSPNRGMRLDSMADVVHFLVGEQRQECLIRGAEVQAYDGTGFTVPFHPSCYMTLAKTCEGSSEGSHHHHKHHFTVLLRAAGKDGRKKLRIVTRKETIEAELDYPTTPSPTAKNRVKSGKGRVEDKVGGSGGEHSISTNNAGGEASPLLVYINDQRVPYNVGGPLERPINGLASVRFVNGQKTEVEIGNEDGASVRFDGYGVRIQLPLAQRNSDCGLCGNTAPEEDGFTHENRESSGKSGHSNGRSFCERYLMGEDEDGDEESCSDFCKLRQSSTEAGDVKTIDPIKLNKAVESHDKICFSMHPLMQCPSGTRPVRAHEQGRDSQSGDKEEEREEESFEFVCTARSNTTARRLLRRITRLQRHSALSEGGKREEEGRKLEVEVAELADNMSLPTRQIPVRVPTACVRLSLAV